MTPLELPVARFGASPAFDLDKTSRHRSQRLFTVITPTYVPITGSAATKGTRMWSSAAE
jgi:hypothetical protein